MKKFLPLILILILTSCTTQKVVSEKKTPQTSIYNIYGKKIFVEITNCEPNTDKLNRGIYYIEVIENKESSPYWTKIVKIDL